MNFKRSLSFVASAFAVLLITAPVAASPFGQGVFGANVPFGSLTSIAINLGGNVTVPMNQAGGIFSGSGSHTVTVTSTDVVGYKLYVHALNSANMTNSASSAVIPASANGTAAVLATNTWGYNIDGSANYLGMSTVSTLLKSMDGPYKNGDATTVTYGAKADVTKDAGNYSVSVIYTAVATNP